MWRNYDIQTVFISQIIDGLIEGDIAIPSFQRDLCWSDDQKLDFLNAVVCDNVPPGMIYSWSRQRGFKRGEDGFSFKEFPWQKKRGNVSDLILDGQHRLVAVAEAFIQKRFLWDIKNQRFVVANDLNRDDVHLYDPMCLVSIVAVNQAIDKKYPDYKIPKDVNLGDLRQAQDVRFGVMFIRYPDIDHVLNSYQKIAWGGSPASVEDFEQFVEARRSILG